MSSASRTDTPLVDRAGLTGERLAERLAFFEIGPEDERRLGALAALGATTLDTILTEFYEHLVAFTPMADLLAGVPAGIDRLRALQRDYFARYSDGRLDAQYVEGRLRVGAAHQEAGLEPAWYVGAFALYLRLLLRRVLEGARVAPGVVATVETLVKVVALDISLAIDAYILGGFVDRRVARELEEAAAVAAEALRAREETERLKDDFASMVVHDLKNPVNGILMMAQLALRKSADIPVAHRGYLEQIARTCREMQRLIQNLLEIAKLEEGKMPVACEVVDVHEVAADVLRDYAAIAHDTGRRLDARVPVGSLVQADPALLKRVLVNLVANALRHSGSTVVELVMADGATATERTIRVVDRGQGIPTDMQSRIFDKFRTLRPSPADDPAEDTGLGLPFCKLAVEHMGGHITVESRPGEGATFAVVLPRPPASG